MTDSLDAVGNVARWCGMAESLGASDVFLSEGAQPRVRVDGTLRVLADQPPVAREDFAVLWNAAGERPEAHGDQDIHWECQGRRYRANLHRHGGKLGAVLRLISREIPSLESLYLPARVLQEWGRRTFGLILITGPTGSGKSTTVASLLEWINHWRPAHVVTIEEPVEYVFRSKLAHFTQREIPGDLPDFPTGLRSAVRQSPDVIFMGEVRDFESAKIALQAAETGHLVVTTLHTSTVTETMERLTNLMPPSEREGVLSLLSTQLVGVLCQKLLPCLKGGRHVVTEHFQNEGATRDWIAGMRYQDLADFLHSGKAPNNVDFLASLRQAWADGWISKQVALDAAPSPHELERAMRGIAMPRSA